VSISALFPFPTRRSSDLLLVGGSLFLAGFAGCAWVAWKWAASGFGPLHEVRKVLFWSMWLFIGVQVTFASFFLSMLGISRGTYRSEEHTSELQSRVDCVC